MVAEESTGAVHLRCQATESAGGRPLAEAAPELTDARRASLLLQGAALLGHLERAGARLVEPWEALTIDGRGRLGGARHEAGTQGALRAGLLGLAAALFGADSELAGRGRARRAMRRLVERWRKSLVPLRTDGVVAQLLERLPELGQPHRHSPLVALVAEVGNGALPALHVVGPPVVRRVLRRKRVGYEEAAALLRGGLDALAAVVDDPAALAREGRWADAVRCWRRDPPADPAARLLFAEGLHRLGLFRSSLDALGDASSAEAEILRLKNLHQLGESHAARKLLGRLEPESLPRPLRLSMAEVAVRLAANGGNAEAGRDWVAVARSGARGACRREAVLLAAESAWDRGALEEMESLLLEAREMVFERRLAWRYHQAWALLLAARSEGRAAVEAMRRALGDSRRELAVHQAGRLWNDMVLARVLADDLPGAERACRHAIRLLSRCEGPASLTLAHHNMAEIRIRRGRFEGVEEIVERSRLENKRSHNRRGGIEDHELRLRLLVARGQLHEAVDLAHEILDRGEWREQALQILLARAQGLLSRPAAAGAALEGVSTVPCGVLEPEERPALWALAGEPERARESLPEGPAGRLWRRLLSDREVPGRLWDRALEDLEDYRAARLVVDVEQSHPQRVPLRWRQRALATFSRLELGRFAELLRPGVDGAWRAVAAFLAAPPEPAAVERLFQGLGVSARLEYVGADGDRMVVVPGADRGGPLEVTAADGGAWRLLAAGRGAEQVALALASSRLRPPVVGPSPAPSASTVGGVGRDRALLRAWQQLDRLGRSEIPVLILGETGTGKELAARRVHAASGRRRGPFLALNCAAMSEELGLSELFGHVRGAFTGAERDRAGVFETAQGGTVFLDEIGDLPARAQGMLLRALQEGEIRRLGESEPRSVDVRIVAATNVELEEAVAAGSFREDLYYRIGVAAVRLPPLRDRGEDCVLLARHFVREVSEGTQSLSADVEVAIRSCSWPGNVRQLRNVVERACALAGGRPIELEDLGLPAGEAEPRPPWHDWLDQLKRERLQRALERTGGNQAAAARDLGLTRQALSYLVRQLGVL